MYNIFLGLLLAHLKSQIVDYLLENYRSQKQNCLWLISTIDRFAVAQVSTTVFIRALHFSKLSDLPLFHAIFCCLF